MIAVVESICERWLNSWHNPSGAKGEMMWSEKEWSQGFWLND